MCRNEFLVGLPDGVSLHFLIITFIALAIILQERIVKVKLSNLLNYGQAIAPPQQLLKLMLNI